MIILPTRDKSQVQPQTNQTSKTNRELVLNNTNIEMIISAIEKRLPQLISAEIAKVLPPAPFMPGPPPYYHPAPPLHMLPMPRVPNTPISYPPNEIYGETNVPLVQSLKQKLMLLHRCKIPKSNNKVL